MSLSDSSPVAVDGNALRHIREQKRLTQLYVSKVVGVTTDTVSRWENNRYPTIRRENAVKLAEALEVDLEKILKQDAPEDSGTVVWQRFLKKFWPLAALLVAGLFFFWFMVLPQKSPVAPILQAQRFLPVHVAPGHELLIQVKISSDTVLRGVILKEEFPQGWHFVSSEPEVAGIDKEAGVARWIFRNPELPLRLYYRLAVPRDADLEQDVRLTGEVIANPDGQQFVMPLVTAGTTRIRPFHWADTNADYVIDDMEILVFSELTENTSELDDEWYVVEQMWHAGSYGWDEDRSVFIPISTFEKPDPGNK